MVAIWREPVRGALGDPRLLRLGGLAALRAVLAGDGRPPPTYHLTGLQLVEVDEGTAVFRLPVSGWLLGPKGTVHAGMLAFLADAAFGCALQTVLPAGTGLTTAELSMTFLRVADRDDTTLTATGKLIHLRDAVGLCEVFVTGRSRRLLAHGTSRCVTFPIDVNAPPRGLGNAETDNGEPDPFLRPALGAVLDGDTLTGRSGLEVLRGQLSGELPLPPIHHLTGIRPVDAAEGRVVFAMPASEWFLNPGGVVYGGAIALLAKSATAGVVQTIAPRGTTYTALDVKVNFLRPVPADGRDLVATGTVVHAGRSMAVSTSEVRDGSGRLVAVATGSTELADGT